jgi:exodeoxyribonuclease VII large subunit
VFEYSRLLQDIEDYQNALRMRMERRIQNLVAEEKRLSEALRHLSPAGKIRDRQLRMDQYSDLLDQLMRRKLESARHRLSIDAERLNGLSPLLRLQGGYSYLTDENGRNIRSTGAVKEGALIRVYVSDGLINARVTGTEEVDFLRNR